MTTLFIDCPTGLAGDMLLAALLDLGLPRSLVEEPLAALGLQHTYELRIQEQKSFGLRGLKLSIDVLEADPPARRWHDIRVLIEQADWSESLRGRVLRVFSILAEAEAKVHGTLVDDVHFHEIGAIDSLIDVVGVCALIEQINPSAVFSTPPPAGHGEIATAHGLLPVPVPAVLELARKHQIPLAGASDFPSGELTTPTGLALMAALPIRFGQPSLLSISKVGIGLGHRLLDRPNLLRICRLEQAEPKEQSYQSDGLRRENVVVQEAWIDDSTPEDVSELIDLLRSGGAIDVVSESVLMKKGRPGVAITALVKSEQAASLRKVWFVHGTTLGLRERVQDRWLLPRRLGHYNTPWGVVPSKQVRHPDGRLSIKPEADVLIDMSRAYGMPVEALRIEISKCSDSFITEEDWSW